MGRRGSAAWPGAGPLGRDGRSHLQASKKPSPASATAIARRISTQRQTRFGARHPPRRDDRPLRGGKRHLVLLLRHPRRHRRAGAEGNRRAASPPTNTGITSSSTKLFTHRMSRNCRSGASSVVAVGRVERVRRRRTRLRLLLRQCSARRRSREALQPQGLCAAVHAKTA